MLFLIEGLHDRFEIHLICPHGWLAKSARSMCHVIAYDQNSSDYKVWRLVRDQYRKIKPNIIHCHGVNAGIIGRLLQNRRGAKMIYTEHLWTGDYHLKNSLREWLQLTLLKWANNKSDKLIAVSESVKKFIINRRMASKNKIVKISGAITPIAPAAHRPQYTIGMLASLNRTKGYDILLDALPIAVEKYPQIKCLVGGEGELFSGLRNQSHRLGIDSQIEWLGKIKNKEKFYQKLSIYVHPSRSESFGMSVLEAMSAGVPVVCSNKGSLKEIISDGQNGLLARPLNAYALANAIIRLFSDRKLVKKLSINGRKYAKRFSAENFVKAHDKLYKEIVKI